MKNNKMLKSIYNSNIHIIFCLLLTPFFSSNAQNVNNLRSAIQDSSTQCNIQIAKWRHNKTAAYSLNLDDFGASHFGDIETIANILDSTNINISFATIANSTTSKMEQANGCLLGNEFVNHSWSHPDRNSLTTSRFAQEVDSSQAKLERLIHNNDPLFFIFPNDTRFVFGFINYISEHKYIGANGGITIVGNTMSEKVNHYNLTDPFSVKSIYYTDEGINEFQSMVDTAILTGNWGFNAAHNVGTGGFMPIPVEDFRAHMNYCKQKVDDGELWVAPVMQVLKYIMERRYFTVEIVSETDSMLELSWNTDRTINRSEYINNEDYNTPLSLIVTTPNGFEMMFDSNPWDGNIQIKYNSNGINAITQGAKRIFPLPTITVNNSLYEFSENANNFDISIEATNDWQIISFSSWLSFSKTEGTGNDIVHVECEKNNGRDTRTAYVKLKYYDIAETTIKVKQIAADLLTASDSLIEFDAESGSSNFNITSNRDWTITTSESWLTVSRIQGSGNRTISVNVEENLSGVDRLGYVVVRVNENLLDTVTVIQSADIISNILEKQNEIKLFPNPTNEYLNLVIDTYEHLAISVFNVFGEIVFEDLNAKPQIDVSNLKEGIYYIKIYGEKTNYTTMFIKH